ncbi:GNAT family N-acetyltransferase [Microbacterium arabinogalactanolyticum]|uniref:GNAT family N-acetyltransferase n=1 Tax=Microbacterium arabinogalactanolyticum TaxID=69365 RepID=UPI002554818C|nr:GNAT family N-acetyltransferase [Microbacterium arabinogalactanolyticum]GLC84477.1 N-acetyltransferase GCN5 [Microbacterium arabinogalactanolyticum]
MNDVILVDLESEDPRWARALPVLRELRPHLTDELFTQVMREAGPQGLRFTAVFAGERCVAIAGWRIVANTSAIRKLYVDDLSTAAADRSRGYGRMLMDELRDRAVAAGCRSLELDSGVQRFDAHRFYLRERMSITAHHFDLEL